MTSENGVSESRFIHVRYLILSKECFNSYLVLSEASNGSVVRYFHTKYFLLSRACELLFKSWLLFKGFSLNYLKKRIGHKITKGLNKALLESLESDLEIELGDDFKRAICRLDDYYHIKDFEYPATGFKSLPLFAQFNDPINIIFTKIDAYYRKMNSVN